MWENLQGDIITIISKTNKKDGTRYPYFLCRFNDGTLIEIFLSNIKNKKFENPNKPTIYKRGFIGQGKFNSVTHYKEYTTWNDMFCRCYNSKTNPSYEGFEVCKRWYNFQTFCEDIPYLKGYNEWKNNKKTRTWSIDKDVLCEKLGIIQKIYSPETCMFITNSDNTKEMMNRRISKLRKLNKYVCINILNNEFIEFGIIKEFSKENNFNSDEVSKCIRGIRESYKGFTFKKII